jgi:WD40 repeat protein
MKTGGREQLSLSTLEGSVGVTAAFSPDGQQAMTSDISITATKVWDVAISGDAEWMNLPAPSGRDPNPYWPGDVQFLPDGRRLVSAGGAGGITISDLETGRKLRTIGVGDSLISSFDVTPDGGVIAAGQDNGLATAWDLTTGDKLFTFHHPEGVVDVDWSPDGEHLVTATRSGSITILDATGGFVRRMHERGDTVLYSARFSPDGRALVTAVKPVRGGSKAFRQTFWDWSSGTETGSIEPGDRRNDAILAVFDPTGSRIVTNGSDGIPRIWDVGTGKSVDELAAHSGPPWDIVYSPDGSRIATAGSDGIVRLFDTATGELILALHGHERSVTRLAFSPDGTKLASLSLDGTVRIWALDLDDLLDIARREVHRTLTDEECRQFLHVGVCPGR